MGGVRGDVIKLGFVQTTIMEMGQLEGTSDDAGAWVRSRQYTGRIVTVSNAKIFLDPVFNYSRDFPFIWEELMVPITFRADAERAEAILLEAAASVGPIDLDAKVFYQITSNWLELTVRFVVGTHAIRPIKDHISRDILKQLKADGITIATTRYDIVGAPRVRVTSEEFGTR